MHMPVLRSRAEKRPPKIPRRWVSFEGTNGRSWRAGWNDRSIGLVGAVGRATKPQPAPGANRYKASIAIQNSFRRGLRLSAGTHSPACRQADKWRSLMRIAPIIAASVVAVG